MKHPDNQTHRNSSLNQPEQEELSLLFSLIPEMLCIFSIKGEFKYQNKAFQEILGWSDTELAEKTFFDFVHPEEQEKARSDIQKLKESTQEKSDCKAKYHFYGQDHSFRFLSFNLNYVREKQQIYASATIQEKEKQQNRKSTNQILKDPQGKFRVLVENSPDVIMLLNPDRTISFINYTLPEYSVEDVLGQDVLSFLNEEDATNYKKKLEEVFTTGETHSLEVSGTSSTYWFVRLIPIKSKNQVETTMVIAHDITERKNAEAALKESEERYSALVEFCPDAILIHRHGKFIYANTAALALFGASNPSKFLGQSLIDFIHPDFRDEVNKKIQQIREKRIRVLSEVGKLFKIDGQLIDIEITAQELIYDGKPAFITLIRDITKRKEREKLFQANEELNRSILEAMPGGIVQVSSEGRIVQANQEAKDILGLSFDEITTKYVQDFDSETIWEDGTHCKAEDYPVSRCLRTGEPQPPTTIGVKRPDSKISWAIFKAVPLREPSINEDEEDSVGAIVTFVDITDRKQLEEEYRQAQKMEAIGHLAGGLAHDFNNLLSAVIGYSEIALLDLTPEQPLYELIKKIEEAGQRAEGLTKQLLAFSRKQMLDTKLLNLSQEVADFSMMLGRLIGEHIQLVTQLAPDLWYVKVDPSQLQQILMNLVVNGRDAMPEGGELLIKTKNVILDQGQTPAGVKPGFYVLLSVKDNGHGIDTETLQHIFDPFFTTKKVGKGTGLGLSTVYGIVKQHNGHIKVTSDLEKGTSFEIYWPLVETSLSTHTEEASDYLETGGDETILVVEDEEIVRKLVCKMLSSNGYKIIEALNGNDAVSIIQKENPKIDLLFTDVVMPGMNGKELFNQLKKTFSKLNVVYMSGYSQDVIDHKGVLKEGVHFLQKPFTQQKLLHKVREALNASK